MRRHNQRVYRVARAVLKDETEAEDVMQQAYLNAFTHLDQFAERAQFSTWLTRITVHEALARRRRRKTQAASSTADGHQDGEVMESLIALEPDPERQAYAAELGQVLESAIDGLPDTYRIVFMLREVEGLSTSETAAGVGLGEEAVEKRRHRARVMLRGGVTPRPGAGRAPTLPFPATRGDPVAAAGP